MASIYDTVSGWSNSVNYIKYNIVSGSNLKYYYAVANNSTSNPTNISFLQNTWDGYININSVLVPNFFWKPSYTSNISTTPDINIIQYGYGYQQRLNQTINPNLANFDAQFDNRLESEAVTLLHFLNARSAKEAFIYNVPTIYSKINFSTRFIAPNWSVSYNSYNNYSIKVKLQEVSA
jgi:phage-related protein